MRDQYAAQTEWYSTVQSAYESLPSTTSNPGWIQLACFTGTTSKSDVYIKAYRSIPVTEYSYITYLPSLQKTLERVSHETGDRVSVKFPRGLL